MTSTPVPSAVKRLVPAQALFVLGISVDLTLTSVVGAHLAPTRSLATLPFALMPIAAAVATVVISRAIGRYGYRSVLTVTPLAATVGGGVCAAAVVAKSFPLFCIGTALIGVYQALSGYYRYVAAESWPQQRARAVSTLLGGGLIAAVVGPFLATGMAHVTSTPYVGSYVMASLAALAASLWNRTLPSHIDKPALVLPDGTERTRGELWRQPQLRRGVAATTVAAVAMTVMMTAGPLAGMDMGHSDAVAAFAMQAHLVGMFAPGFVVARWLGRLGERRVAALGAAVLAVAGVSALASTTTLAFALAMFAVGVGWNLASSGGSALIAGAYRAGERARVQPIAEVINISAQVVGSLAAGTLATQRGWAVTGAAVVCIALALAVALVSGSRRRVAAEASAQ